MSRQRLFALVIAASVLAALPGVQPFARSSAPLTTAHGDVWHDPAAPLATAAQRTDRVSVRPSRNVIAGRHATAAIVFALTIVGAIRAANDRAPAVDRTNPPGARAPPRLFRL